MAIFIKEEPRDLEDLIMKLYINKYDTYAKSDYTYMDKECSKYQCEAGRYRSFDDLLELAQTYFPEVTPAELMHTLLVTDIRDIKNNELYLYMGNCSTIKRVRIIYSTSEEACYQDRNCNKYDSKYSWMELLKMLGLETTKEISDYVKKYRENKNLKYEALQNT